MESLVNLALLAARARKNHQGGAGGDPYWANVVSLLHMDGGNASTSFVDVVANTWAASGNAQQSTSAPLYGTASGVFDGAGDFISTADAAWNNLSSGDFTIEISFNGPRTQDSCIVSKRISGATGWAIEVRATGAIWWRGLIGGTYGEPKIASPIGTVQANTLTRIALQRAGNTWSIFSEGTQVASANIVGVMDNPAVALRIGTANTAGEEYLLGKVDEFRLTKGIARYASNYTPSSGLFPNHA